MINPHISRQFLDKTGTPHARHPVHGYYFGAIFMDAGGYAALKLTAAQRPPTDDEVRCVGQQRHV
jgi:hypothetical protein